MATDYYTEPRITIEQFLGNIPEGFTVKPPEKPYFGDNTPEGWKHCEQYLVLGPGGAIWIYKDTQDSEHGHHVRDTARFVRFGFRDADPLMSAVEKTFGVKVFDEFGVSFDDSP